MNLRRYQTLQSRADRKTARKAFIFHLTKLCRDEIGFRFLREEGGDIATLVVYVTLQGHALLDQTVKYPIQNSTTEAVENISSPQMPKHKVKPAKKKLKSILKKSKQAIQSRVVSTADTSTSGEQMLVRGVSLPSEPSPERGCKKAKKSRHRNPRRLCNSSGTRPVGSNCKVSNPEFNHRGSGKYQFTTNAEAQGETSQKEIKVNTQEIQAGNSIAGGIDCCH